MRHFRWLLFFILFNLPLVLDAQVSDSLGQSWETLQNTGLEMTERGEYDKALQILEEARVKVLKIFGNEHFNYAQSLIYLANLNRDMSNYSKAQSLYLEAIEIRSKVFGKQHQDYAYALFLLAELYGSLGNLSKSEPLYIESIEVFGKTLGKEDIIYALAIFKLAELYQKFGHYAKAEPLYTESKEIWAKTLGKEHQYYATVLQNLGQLYQTTGNYTKAEPLFIESKEIKKNMLGKEHPDYASGLNELALLYQAMDFFSKAESLFLETKEIRAKVLGKAHPSYSISLNNLGLLYFNMGNYTKAEPLYLEAQQITVEVLGKEHREYATILNNMAQLVAAMGNFFKAEALYLESIGIIAKVLGKEHSTYALSLNNLASLYDEMGNELKAEALYLEANEIFAKALGKEHPTYATSLINLAMVYIDIGNYSKAQTLLYEAKEIFAKALGKEHSHYSITLMNLAFLYHNMGNYSKAEPLYLEAQQIISKVMGKEHPWYVAVLNNLAALYHETGNFARAELHYLESIKKSQLQILHYFPSLSEKEKQNYYVANKIHFQNFEAFCVRRYTQNQALLNELYNLKLATKGLLFYASNKVRQRILGSKDKLLIATYEYWKSKKDFLAKVYQMGTVEKQQKGVDEKLLEEQANTLEKKLSLQSELFATVAEQHLYKWEEVREKLKRGEVAIEMIRVNKFGLKKIMVDSSVSLKQYKQYGLSDTIYYAALIVTPTSKHPNLIVLKNGNELETRSLRFYHNAITTQTKDVLSYIQFWKPLTDQLKEVKKVYFSADGVYNQINLNTLYNPATGKYVMDEIEVQMVTSTKELVTNTKATRKGIEDASLFGYPNYNNSKTNAADSSRSLSYAPVKTAEIKTDSAQRFFNGDNINELPGTKVEIETIEALLKKKNISLHEYLFNEATESEIKKLNNPQVLHVATHGFFLSDLPTPKENERGFAGMDAKKFVENPLLRSGLLFAGVKSAFTKSDKTTTKEGEDGILTSYEAMSLDLDQTDLVVMSACETGLGVTANGEGVYGLQRAFQVAGAKSVLMSLWTVSDEATQKLMTLFYENWLGGKTPREAFRIAQLSLREKYPQPYYWGAFVLVGN